ncbi:unnamed protein product [Diatraea saccharalis]|uniref:Uncharacterized protein n=1 Tax=Diatraea saccharalis TaxID=40085 RepID=A0A9N9QU00_9NEOP|nr:unnamed protein product [Diatraea saccharalis]
MRLSKTIVKVFGSCCLSTFTMEILMFKTPNSANLITFLQFFFISLQGFIFTTKCGSITPKIPLKQYAILTGLFFITHVSNNYVYALHVPSTLHMIIRSASSPVGMLVYCIMKQQSPKLSNALGSILISIGIGLAMYGGTPTGENRGNLFYWCIGVSILLSTLVTGALTGLQQETLFRKFGKHPDEMMFYTHAIGLPFFISMYPHLQNTALNLPWDIWILISLNTVFQFYCTHSVHELATKETSVTVTFILTLRKFISLLISSIIFKNNLTLLHVIGTIFVTAGTCIYFEFFSYHKQRPVNYKSDYKKL